MLHPHYKSKYRFQHRSLDSHINLRDQVSQPKAMHALKFKKNCLLSTTFSWLVSKMTPHCKVLAVVQFVKARSYKPEGRGFRSPDVTEFFSLT
jgi:hypothetical protein